MKIVSEQEMLDFGQSVAKQLFPALSAAPVTIELLGDVGAGKTTFTRGLAASLGVTAPVTSPSFTISKTYALPTGGTLTHYDFYRLPDPGLMVEDLAETINTPGNLTVVEWAETVADVLPADRIKILFKYNDDGTREVEIINNTQTTTISSTKGQTL